MPDVEVTHRGAVPLAEFAKLRLALRQHRSVGDVLAWLQARGEPIDSVEVVIQDEFTHDLILPLGGSLHAVYDTS